MATNDSEKQQVGESDLNYRRRQQIQAKKEGETQKGNLVNRGVGYGKNQLNKAKDYGAEKGKDAIKGGADFAKEKGKNFLDKNPKAAGAINKAQQVKQDFENRMNAFRDSAELNARKPPIKQNPGESDGDFRKRQQKEDADKPESQQRMSLGGAAKQHAKDYGKRQLGKGTDYAKNKGKDILAKNPKIAAAAEKAKARASAIKEKLAIAKAKKDEFTKRIKTLKNKYDPRNIKKKFEDEFKKLAWQYLKQFIKRIAISFAIPIILLFLKILLIFVIIIASTYYLCQDSWLGQAVCSIFL